ncbi:MAG: hypothetical protein ACJZ10_06365 [Candidatus Neomarinimicrobiota bacterium]
MTLLKCTTKRIFFAITIFMLVGSVLSARKLTLEGQVLNEDGKRVKKAELTLSKDGSTLEEEKTKGNGKFKFKKLEEGEYVLGVSHEKDGSADTTFFLSENTNLGEITLSTKPVVRPVVVENSAAGEASVSSLNPAAVSITVPQTVQSMGSPNKDFIINELNFEIKKLNAEIKHLTQDLDDLKALSKMWVNPLTIYSKEIILKNGSTVFGKIIYQDDKSLKVETLVGYLIVDRAQVVRIVDNVITEDSQEYVPEQIRESYAPPPMPKLAQPRYTSSNNSARMASAKLSANCVLVGNIAEKKDSQGNIIFDGEIKNIGGRRADFVKVDFVFRKNWSGETRTLTTFVKGSYNTFDTGIVSDASLLPGANGKFDLYVPQDFGTFIGYSYVIDWEEYQ